MAKYVVGNSDKIYQFSLSDLFESQNISQKSTFKKVYLKQVFLKKIPLQSTFGKATNVFGNKVLFKQ